MTLRLTTLTALAFCIIACSAGVEKEPGSETPQPLKGETLVSNGYSIELPLGLQADAAYIPDDNPLTAGKIELGRKLFFDPRLSHDGSVSCATCHAPDMGFSDGSPVSTGIESQKGGRNAPTVMNRLFSVEQFWDGRSPDLEDQALGPIQNPIEMGHTLSGMIDGLGRIAGYEGEFRRAFGSPGITAERVARAIASYERIVLAGNAPYDRYQAGDTSAMSESAVRGMEIFNDPTKGNCVTCHAGFNFTDESYHNLGVGMDNQTPDLGRYAVTKNDEDRGAFKTPTLRNITDSAPYMHDGSEATLEAVIDFYDRGGVKSRWRSEEIRRLNLTPRQKADLLAFMMALSGEVGGTEQPVLP